MPADGGCDDCGNPLFFGEIAYRDQQTGVTGCSHEHCHSAINDHNDAQEVHHFRACFEGADL